MRVVPRLMRVALMAALLLAIATVSYAQNAGATVLVEVRDTSGAPVPGTVVTVSAQLTKLTRIGTTVRDGTTWITRLPAGVYTLTAVRGGFKTQLVREIRIETDARSQMSVVLEPGEYSEQVEVTADASTLRIGNAAVGTVLGSDTLLALPSATRDVLEFATQAPGMAPPAPGSRLSTQGNTGMNSAVTTPAAIPKRTQLICESCRPR